jgi:DNA adenine methylase
MNNNIVLRYPGGKSRACKLLDKIFKEYFDESQFDNLISPFIGGASFEFYFQNKYNKKVIANDLFTPLFNFWMQVKTDKILLTEKLKLKKNISKSEFEDYKNKILELNDDQLEQAYYYFIVNRCSFSGSTTSGGFSCEASKKRYTLSSIIRIENLNLDNFDFYNEDFEKFINDNATDKSLLFLDPPYKLEKGSKLYGTKGDLHISFDHQKLFDTVKKYKNWIMTYNDCEFIRNLYKDYIILDESWAYGMNKSKKSSEIVIVCSSFIKPV